MSVLRRNGGRMLHAGEEVGIPARDVYRAGPLPRAFFLAHGVAKFELGGRRTGDWLRC
jgi:hypothetical protein